MNLFTRFLIASLAVGCAHSAAAQQVFFGDGARPADQNAAQKKAFERELSFLIGDMQRTCKLSEAQVKKLQIASKGAVASAMEKFEKQQKQVRQRMRQAGVNLPGLNIDEEDEADDEEDEADDEEDEADDGAEESEDDEGQDEAIQGALPQAVAVNIANMLGVPGNNVSGGSVTKEPRWVKSVEKVVTKEQRETYVAKVKERAAFARKAAVAAFIARVDVKLLLSPDQRQKLTALVDDDFGKLMGERISQRSGQRIFFMGGGERQTAPIAHEELKPLFSEAQFAEWKQTFENELNQLKPQRGGFGGGFGNVIIRGAPAVQEIRIEADGGDN